MSEEKRNIISDFMKKSANFIRSIGRRNAPGIFVSTPQENSEVGENIQAKSRPPGLPIADSLIYAKQHILKELNFNIIFADEFKKGAEFSKNVQDSFRTFRNAVADAQTKESLIDVISAINKSNDELDKNLRNNKTEDNRIYANLNKFFYQKNHDLGGNNPKHHMDRLLQSYEDRKSAGLLKSVVFSNNRDDLLDIGRPIDERPGFDAVELKCKEVTKRFGINFIGFSEDNDVNLKKAIEFENSAADFSKRMGMTEDCVGIKKSFAYIFEERNGIYGGYSSPSGFIALAGKIDSSIIAHEWIHSLDSKIMIDLRERTVFNPDPKSKLDSRDKNAFHVSESTKLPYDFNDSDYLKSYRAMVNYTNNILFSSDNKDSSLVTERKEEITKSVLKAALADTYFSLSSAEIKKLSSGRGVDLMIERALNPKDRKTGEKLAEYMRECVGDNFYVKERIDWFSQIPYAGPLQVAAENFKAISPDGHSPLVESELLIKSRKVDIEATKERLKNKNPDTIGLINKTGNSLNDDYFQSQVELVARYTEGQIYPDIVSSSRDGNAYSIKKDKNFDKLREELISCFFGKDAVKEPEYPENVKLIWEKQNNPNFLKTKKVEINSVPSRFEKVVDYLKEKPAQKLAEMFKSVQSIYEKQKNKEVNAQAPESDVTKITMRVNEVRMNIKESSPTSQETSSLKRGNKL